MYSLKTSESVNWDIKFLAIRYICFVFDTDKSDTKIQVVA